MIKRESLFTTKFNKWLRHNWRTTGPIEVKVSETGRINVHQFPDHQKAALLSATDPSKSVIWKIPDAGWSNLFDIVVYSGCQSFVCLVFNVKTSKKFYIIDAKIFFDFFQGKVVSILETEAEELALQVGEVR